MGNNENINNNSHQAMDDRASKRTGPIQIEEEEVEGILF